MLSKHSIEGSIEKKNGKNLYIQGRVHIYYYCCIKGGPAFYHLDRKNCIKMRTVKMVSLRFKL
jgi:hypothetical protein